MIEKLYRILDESYDEMVDIRRYLHMYPELSFQEVETPKYIANYHRQLGHEVTEGVGERGVVAKLHGSKPGPTVALRADFDALPIHEENDVPYKSKVAGVMHACGHDGHTAQLLVLAKALNKMKDQLTGTVVFIHQHAEEYSPGGAIAMIEDGCLEGVDVIYGTHLWATAPLGTIQYTKGEMMAAADRFEIIVHGQGGHGAEPHLTKDAVLIGSHIVQALHHIVSRRVDPLDNAVVSIGSFEASNAFNVIANSAKLIGTVRTFKKDVQDFIMMEIERISKNIATAYGATVDLKYDKGYPPVINDPEVAEFVKDIALKTPGVTNVELVPPVMGGEDYSYYLQRVKGAFFFTGAKDSSWEKVYPHHHPSFNIDERSMLVAAKTLGHLTIETLMR